MGLIDGLSGTDRIARALEAPALEARGEFPVCALCPRWTRRKYFRPHRQSAKSSPPCSFHKRRMRSRLRARRAEGPASLVCRGVRPISGKRDCVIPRRLGRCAWILDIRSIRRSFRLRIRRRCSRRRSDCRIFNSFSILGRCFDGAVDRDRDFYFWLAGHGRQCLCTGHFGYCSTAESG